MEQQDRIKEPCEVKKLREFAKTICSKYEGVNFNLETVKGKFYSKDTDEIQLTIKNEEGAQLSYNEIPICSVTDQMVNSSIFTLSVLFKMNNVSNPFLDDANDQNTFDNFAAASKTVPNEETISTLEEPVQEKKKNQGIGA